MREVLLLLAVVLTVATVVFGVTMLVSGRDPGLVPTEPDGRAVPLPGGRPLAETDVAGVRFDTALRGYRMAQVDEAMRRAAYDIGYKSELISVLEAEVDALRDGRIEEADALRQAREEAAATGPADAATAEEPGPAVGPMEVLPAEPGVAEAPAAAAVEDVAARPTPTDPAPVAPVAAPVAAEAGLRPSVDVPAGAGPEGGAADPAAAREADLAGDRAAAPVAGGADLAVDAEPAAARETDEETARDAGAADDGVAATRDDADTEGERERGPAVRSESA